MKPRRRLALLSLLSAFLVPVTATAEEELITFQRQENVVYHERHGVGLVMDVFRPKLKSNGLALVDVISGSWDSSRGKMRDHERAQVFQIMCERGYTVFAVRPGSLPKFSIPEMVSHLEVAIVWVKNHADQYDIDPRRVGLMGASAGGHLASLVAVKNGRSTTEPSRQADVKAVGAFFPPTDLLQFGPLEVDPTSEDGVAALVRRVAFPEGVDGLTKEEIRQAVIDISPARLVTPNTPPFLLIHGTADPLVPLQQSEALKKALEQENVEVELIIKPRGGHPWPTIHEEVRVMADWFDKTLAED